MKCTDPSTAESQFSRCFQIPVSSVECKGSKLPSLCRLKRVSTQTPNPISANTKPDYSFSTPHPSNTAVSPTVRKFLGFPTPFPSTGNRTVPWSAALTPRCPGWTRCLSTTLQLSHFWLESHSAFSRAHKNKQNKSSQHTQ